MDATLLLNFRSVEENSEHIYHLGDYAFRMEEVDATPLPIPQEVARHTLVAGNHDKLSTRAAASAYNPYFQNIIGLSSTWRANALVVHDTLHGRPVRLLLSHEAQSDLQGCHYNLYGHHHSNMLLKPDQYLLTPRPGQDWNWLYNSHVHFNVSVEVIDYTPRTLEEIIHRTQGKSMREQLSITR